MNKKNYFKVALIVLLSTISLVSSARGKSEGNGSPKFYFNNYGTKELAASQEVYEWVESRKYLKPMYKYDFVYDAQNRVVEKHISKWEAGDGEWFRLHKLTYTYTGEALTIEFSRWNRTKETYGDVSEKSVYALKKDRFTSYSNYTRKTSSDEWKQVTSYLMDIPANFHTPEKDFFIARADE
jgi:hypothetical protein